MINVALICECNPFHFGHIAQYRFIKESFPGDEVRTICIMSGNYVQRGDLAILQKYRRAETAVKNGASLVLELPFPFSILSAEGFAQSAVQIISRLPDIDYICFGSECGDKDRIVKTAKNLESKKFSEKLAKLTKSKYEISYAAIRENLYFEMFSEELIKGSNDILAIEYCRALSRAGSGVLPLVLTRNRGYSASLAREAIFKSDRTALTNLVPNDTLEALNEAKPLSLSALEEYILTFFSLADADYLSSFYEVSSDLAHKMTSSAKIRRDLDMFINDLSDKRYTRARVRRALLSAILGVKREYVRERPLYTQLLALDRLGREYLKDVAERADIPIVSRRRELYENKYALAQYDRSMKADQLYNRLQASNGTKIIKNPFSIN